MQKLSKFIFKLSFPMILILMIIFLSVPRAFSASKVIQPGPEGKDSWVDDAFPDENHGSDTGLFIGKGPAPTWYSFLEFNLSSIPAGSTINSATLSLYFYSFNLPGPMVASTHRVLGSWGENTITWNNMPVRGGVNFSSPHCLLSLMNKPRL